MADDQDSFEKIELEQCALDETSTDCKVSSDLTTDRQHSTSKSLASTMASSTVQVKVARLANPRDEITSSQRRKLSGLTVKAEVREEQRDPTSLIKRNSSVIRNLAEKIQKVCIELIVKWLETSS